MEITAEILAADIDDLVDNMRHTDLRELRLTEGVPPHQAVEAALSAPGLMAVARDDNGWVVAMGGFRDAKDLISLGRVGIPWMLATHRLAHHSKTLMAESRAALNRVLGVRYDHLQNVVWEGNEPSIRYLQRLGFRFGAPYVNPTNGAKLRAFYMQRGGVT